MPQSAALHPLPALNAVDPQAAPLTPTAASGAAIRSVKAAPKRTPAL